MNPTARQERINSVDVLRGVALLGILLLNIPSFGVIESAEGNPTVGGAGTPLNIWTWFIVNVLFEGKMRAIFSMLFGAGLILMTSRAEERGDSGRIADIWLRRNLWLLFFGMVHAYFIWAGDILYAYGLTGLLLYPFRKLRPIALLWIGVGFLSIQTPKTWMYYHETQITKADHDLAVEVEKTKLPLTDALKESKEAWETQLKDHNPSKTQIEKELRRFLRGYREIFSDRVGSVSDLESSNYYRHTLFDVAGMMFLGMALLKWRVLTAERSLGLYTAMMIGGYAVGIPIRALTSSMIMKSNWDILTVSWTDLTYDLTRIATAAGHVGLVLLVCKQGWVLWLTRRLAAVGQMALTNYLLHSLICTTYFYGYGFAMYGKLERYQLYYVVAAIWAVQIIFSPIWLKHFQYGPLEWAWRSLTYWQRQPMRIEKPEAATNDQQLDAAVDSR